MILAGLQKNSFIDYPGKISCVLFLTGCNFVCPYCHNGELARGEYPERIGFPQTIDFLKSRQGLLEGVTITGGEPTLNSGLFDLCRAIKALDYPVKLDTNGSHPTVIHRLLEQQLVDFVAMDIKAPPEEYHRFYKHPKIAVKLAKSIQIIMETAPNYEFRTTCVTPFINKRAIEAIGKIIQGAQRYVLQPFNRRAQCLDPMFNHQSDPSILPDGMQRLKTLATPFVQRCIIR